ncbi:hypothetical protein GUITHDRAFT_100698 [Guillardia theta CCMP2712]|uniref:CCDC81 HU domain-containing protein n=1 Tax=Guillardia theta (strain CCMP2712) TaxID=905079 RepID=L1JZJ7_GUITC|nr:hypothetical protein GUITHDRAFT_100698 [Guillardia theta CCMP2712]EKX53729.1 hypothetical protein GUITHDRAFT_100698 [Guillardia theta CCMP2712]|eukprot:XP_005840709.1 hypothetical protein GUITHDRAFT_100698 [Guillardia theta CCMP2712]
MTFTESSLAMECARNPRRKIKSSLPSIGETDVRLYKAVWTALCNWIIETMEQGRGINIQQLMRLSWAPESGNSDVILRPVFRSSPSFERTCMARPARESQNHAEEDSMLERCEDINFHKIAIRYTSTLTKDVVYSCLRELFYGLERAVQVNFTLDGIEKLLGLRLWLQLGEDLKVHCGVGYLICKSGPEGRKLSFDFLSKYNKFRPPPHVSHKKTSLLRLLKAKVNDMHRMGDPAADGKMMEMSILANRATVGLEEKKVVKDRLDSLGLNDPAEADEKRRTGPVDAQLGVSPGSTRDLKGRGGQYLDMSATKSSDEFIDHNQFVWSRKEFRWVRKEKFKHREEDRVKVKRELTKELLDIMEQRRLERKKEKQARLKIPTATPFFCKIGANEKDKEVIVKVRREKQKLLKSGLEEQIAYKMSLKKAQENTMRTSRSPNIEIGLMAETLSPPSARPHWTSETRIP